MTKVQIALVLALLITAATSPAMAQGLAVDPGGPRISLDLTEVPLAKALQTLFELGGAEFALGQGVALDRTVSIKMNDVPFQQALEIITRMQNLNFRQENGVYFIEAVSRPSGLPSGLIQMFSGFNDAVTLNLTEMPVEEAVRLICSQQDSQPDACNWKFAPNLAETKMPGVKFYQFPMDQAVRVALVASGLTPPAQGQTQVNARGTVKIRDVITWSPEMLISMPSLKDLPREIRENTGGDDDMREAMVGSIMARTMLAGFLPPLLLGSDAISIAARHEPSTKAWLYTVFASQASDIKVVERLLNMSGASYVMAEAEGSSPEQSALLSSMIENTRRRVEAGVSPQSELEKALMSAAGKQRRVSVQLYDLPLSVALETLAATLNLKIETRGNSENPTFVIGGAATGGGGS